MLLPECRVDPQGQERIVRVIVQVHGGDAAGQDVHDTHRDDLPVEPVLLVKGAEAALGPGWGLLGLRESTRTHGVPALSLGREAGVPCSAPADLQHIPHVEILPK